MAPDGVTGRATSARMRLDAPRLHQLAREAKLCTSLCPHIGGVDSAHATHDVYGRGVVVEVEREQRARTATEVVTAAAGGTIATVEEAAMAAAVEAGDGLVCDGSATEEWIIGRRASIGFWSEIRIHFCPHEPRTQNTL